MLSPNFKLARIYNFKFVREALILWLLYALSVVVVYYMPSFTKYPYFILLLVLAYFSRKDYWWLAFFVILFAQIGDLLPEIARIEGIYQRIPVYGLGPIRLPFYDLIVLMFLVKALPKKSEKSIYTLPLMFVGAYILCLYIYSMLYGMTLDNHLQSIRALFQFTLIYSLHKILKDQYDLYKLYSFLFSAVFVIMIVTAIEIFTGFKLGSISGVTYRFGVETENMRIFNSPFLLLLCFIMSLYMLYNKCNKYFSRQLLISISFLCYVLIFLTGTRGWFLSFSIMFLLSILVYRDQTRRIVFYVVPIIAVLVISINIYPKVSVVFEQVWDRIATLKLLAEGDLTAGGTVSRVTERMPRLLTKVRENPITGFGFSKDFYINSDNHVGPLQQLLQMGIIGLGLYIFLFVFIHKKNRYLASITKDNGYYMFSIGLIGLLIIHFTSTSLFNFSGMGGQRQTVELFAILLTSMNIFIKEGYQHILKRKRIMN